MVLGQGPHCSWTSGSADQTHSEEDAAADNPESGPIGVLCEKRGRLTARFGVVIREAHVVLILAASLAPNAHRCGVSARHSPEFTCQSNRESGAALSLSSDSLL